VLGGSKVRDGSDPVLVGVGRDSLRGERTKGGPPCGTSWLEADMFYFVLFPVCSAGGKLGIRTRC